MATIINRSPIAVSVRRNPDLYQEFPVFRQTAADAYAAELRKQGYQPHVKQLENAFQVLARNKGYKDFCATFDSYEEAEKTCKELEAKRALSIFRDYAAATRHTLATIMERYSREVCPKHKGADTEICRLKRMMRDESFVHKQLAEVTTEDIVDFINDRLTAVSPSTVDRDLDLLNQVLNYADRVWKIAASENPMRGVPRPKYFNERDRRLKSDEEERLLTAARSDENPYIEPVILLALHTAMRRGEILSLQWRHIDFEARTALLPDTKNGRSRKVPLSAQTIQVLRSLPRDDSEQVFPITANALKLAWSRRVVTRAAVTDLHFHDLRHEATSRLAESSAYSLIELQAITGHRDTRMLLRYSHLCASKLAEKMDRTMGTIREYVWRGRKRRVFEPLGKDVAVLTAPPQPRAATRPHEDAPATLSANVIQFARHR